jgi:dihydroxyacetone kinase
MLTKKVVNQVENAVYEAVEGLLCSNSNLRRLGNSNVVVRADIDSYKDNHVTIVSGGGAGTFQCFSLSVYH